MRVEWILTGFATVLGEKSPLHVSPPPSLPSLVLTHTRLHVPCTRQVLAALPSDTLPGDLGTLTLIKEPTHCPTAHQTLRNVNRYCFDPGKNSKNIVPSTGRFPPAAKPTRPIKTLKVT